MGSMSHPNPTLPVPSRTELPLTKCSGDLRVGGHKLVDIVSPERCSGGTLRQRPQIPPPALICCRGHRDFPTQALGPSPALMLMQRHQSQGPDSATTKESKAEPEHTRS